MKKIILIGEVARRNGEKISQVHPDFPFIYAKNISEAFKNLETTYQTDVLISRDAEQFAPEDAILLQQLNNRDGLKIIWPPDESIELILQTLTEEISTKEEDGEHASSEEYDNLQEKNAELQSRVDALESAVRSLVAALSQCDPWPEAYADDHETWELLMQGIPSAEAQDETMNEPDYDLDEDELEDE
jgi:hypothetical protein